MLLASKLKLPPWVGFLARRTRRAGKPKACVSWAPPFCFRHSLSSSFKQLKPTVPRLVYVGPSGTSLAQSLQAVNKFPHDIVALLRNQEASKPNAADTRKKKKENLVVLMSKQYAQQAKLIHLSIYLSVTSNICFSFFLVSDNCHRKLKALKEHYHVAQPSSGSQ